MSAVDSIHSRAVLAGLAEQLKRALRLRVPAIRMHLLESTEVPTAISRLRHPQAMHIASQATRPGWTVGPTVDDLVGTQCRVVVGLGRQMAGAWFATAEDLALHQAVMGVLSWGKYKALVVEPLSKWIGSGANFDRPGIVLFYATLSAMIYLINGPQWPGYKRFDWSQVGESSCVDLRGQAPKTREPNLSIPRLPECRYGDVLGDEILMVLRTLPTPRRRRLVSRHSVRTICPIRLPNMGFRRTCGRGWGTVIRRPTRSCNMFSVIPEEAELPAFAWSVKTASHSRPTVYWYETDSRTPSLQIASNTGRISKTHDGLRTSSRCPPSSHGTPARAIARVNLPLRGCRPNAYKPCPVYKRKTASVGTTAGTLKTLIW